MLYLQDNEVIKNSPSKIRGGKGALIFLDFALYDVVFNAPRRFRGTPSCLRGGVVGRYFRNIIIKMDYI